MTDHDRQQARLKLVTLLSELPIGADLSLSVRNLTRAEYDDLPGSNEVTVGSGRGTIWTKDLDAPGILVEFWTEESPATPISWPFSRKPDLRVVGS